MRDEADEERDEDGGDLHFAGVEVCSRAVPTLLCKIVVWYLLKFLV